MCECAESIPLAARPVNLGNDSVECETHKAAVSALFLFIFCAAERLSESLDQIGCGNQSGKLAFPRSVNCGKMRATER